MTLTKHARTLVCLLATACTPIRQAPNPTSSNPNGPQIHGEIQTSASAGRGGMAAATAPSSTNKTASANDPASANATATPAPESKARDLTDAFEAPPGLAVTLFAESPAVRNPTAMDVDARGRVWATEGVNYRQWHGRNPGLHDDKGDRVVILEDTDGDGVADTSKVFVQDTDLVAPLGIAVLQDPKDPKVTRVYVSCSPTIWLYTDLDGDDVPDKKEVFLTGFGGHDHDHGVHSMVVGPDGRFYIAVGNAGPHVVKDKNGWTLRSGSIYAGGGENEADNHPALKSDDGKVWVGGLILRCEPDGSNLTVMAHNFRNEYEVALDSFGNMFTADNDDDGNQCCRTCWVMEGGNYGYFSADGSREWQADRRPGQDVWTAHWHQDDPGVCPAGCRNGAGGPTGVCVYEGDLLGPDWTGRVLNCDAGANCVYAHTPVPDGGGYTMKPGMFLKSKPNALDPDDQAARWFRPSDVCVATDGSVFVSDWWDPGVGGHLAGDKAAYGRILRVAPKGAGLVRPHIDVSTTQGAVTALQCPAVHVRALGLNALSSKDEGSLDALRNEIERSSARNYARKLFALGIQHYGPAISEALRSSQPEIRLTAVRAVVDRPECLNCLGEDMRVGLTDASPLVRRAGIQAWVKAARHSPDWHGRKDPGALFSAGQLLETRDLWTINTLGDAIDAFPELGSRGFSVALDEGLRQGASGIDALAKRIHPSSYLKTFAERARSPKLDAQARRVAIESIAFMREKEAGEAMLDLALGGPEDTRELAAWWVEHNDLDLWRGYRLAEQLGPRGRGEALIQFSSGLLTSGSADVDIDVSESKTLWLVVTEGKLGNGFDWADWIEPAFTTPKGDVRLTSLDWVSAKAGWGETHKNLNAAGGPLVFGHTTQPDGIGTHAPSEIVYRVPEGATRFHALAALDEGGTSQPGAHPDVEFQVWADRRRDPARWKPYERALTDAAAKPDDVDAAAKAMSADRDGGLALLRLASTERLTPAGTDAVARHIFRNPDLSVRALASERFTRPGAGAPLAPAAVLGLAGDPFRGSKIFFGDAARCSTCHTFYGKGGDIGPDLSAVSVKYGKPQILDSILNPSAAIAFGYDTFLVETKDGTLENGFVLSEGAELVLKDTSGKRHVIPTSEIVSKTKLKVSTMPDNVSAGLSPQELADVVAMLSTNPRAPGKRGAPRELLDGTSLAGWTFFLEDPKAKMEDVWSVKDGVVHCKGHPIGYLRTTEDFTDYVLVVEWRFDPALGAGNSGVLLRMTGADKVWPRSVESQLNSGDAGDIWNIDQVPMEVDPSRTQGRRTVKLQPSSEKPLGEWNRYVITLDGGELTLEVNGVKQNEAHWVERVPGKICLQSEGAPIEFRKVEIVPIER